MSMFIHLYNMTDDLKKVAKEPIVKNRLQRKLQAAYDNLASVALDEIETINRIYDKINSEGIDIQAIIKAKAEIENIKATAVMIKEEYQLLFGEVMAVESIPKWVAPEVKKKT